MKFFVCCLVLLGASALASDVDYCAVKAKYCGTKDHLGCKPNAFVANGLSSDLEFIELTQAQKDMLLNMHNELRNKLANGSFVDLGFPAAAAMTELKWDKDLEYMANVHVRYGDYKHDACRATPAFQYAGQNLALQMQLPTYPDVTKSLQNGVNNWFNEINIADPALITKLLNSHMSAGHFSVMVNEKTKHVGCGATFMKYNSSGRIWNAVMLTCNYGYTNMLNTPVYTVGAAASGCATVSRTYPGMCAAN